MVMAEELYVKQVPFIISIFSCLLLTFNPYCIADEISIAADHWCPINCDTSGPKLGVMVEIAKSAFANTGHTITYKIVPWTRAIHDARNGKINGIIGAFLGDAPDFIFPKNELLMISGNAFFVLKESKWRYMDISSLSNITLGAIKGYNYGEIFNVHVEKEINAQFLTGPKPLERNMNKLLLGRIDVIIEAEPVFWYTANKMNLKEKFKAAGQISGPEKCFIAFSPSIPKSKEYAEILSDGVDMLRNTGELKTILNRYGLEDWKVSDSRMKLTSNSTLARRPTEF
jgi:polar amino acid transport system substrate-binding protein